jgi:hypothetical protein
MIFPFREKLGANMLVAHAGFLGVIGVIGVVDRISEPWLS